MRPRARDTDRTTGSGEGNVDGTAPLAPRGGPRLRPPRMRRPAALPLLALLAACAGDAPAPADTGASAAPAAAVAAVDDDGDTVRLARPARRVIGLVPSVTDVALALGAGDRLVGRTRYDVRPEVAGLPSVGGGLDPSVEAIVGLRPDLVVTWQDDEADATIGRIAAAGIPTFALRTEDTTGAFAALARLGHLLGRDSAAAATAAAIRRDFAQVRASVAGRARPRVFYAVGTAPPMTAGPQTFVGQLLGLAGGTSVFDDVRQPWPQVSIEEIVRRDPDAIVLPVFGDDGAARAAALRTLPGWRELRAVREGRVLVVPVELMNRPGPGMGRAARLLRDLLHPEVADVATADVAR